VAKQFTLGKNERLKSRKIIEQLFSEGKNFAAAPFRVYYLFNSSLVPLQFGVGVSSKNFKKAVDRNRVKRLIREAWRLQKLPLQQELQEQDKQLQVFFVYTGRDIPVYKDVFDRSGKIIGKLLNMLATKK
jgi:ribonuclease P protein component